MNRFRLAQILCPIFPPIVSQYLRNLIFPRKMAIALALDFSKKSITGSIFKGNTFDLHGYPFSIHGFFDWRNIILAHYFLKATQGDIIEIGANIGTETIGYSDILSNKGQLHAFEPLPSNLHSLNRLFKNKKNIILYPCALSNHIGTVNFLVPPKTSSGEGRIVNNDSNDDNHKLIRVNVNLLDDYLDSFHDVKLITIDTEGHEPLVLEGSTVTLNRFRPAIILEASPKLLKKSGNRKVKDIYTFLIKNQYHCYKIGRFTVSKIVMEDLDTEVSNNWLCLPKETDFKIKEIKNTLLIRTFIPWFVLPSLSKYAKK